MIRFLFRKFANALFTLWSVCTVVFFLFSASFPSPEEMLVTDRADQATIEAIRHELGLDKTVMQQYGLFLNDLSPLSYYSSNDKLNQIDHWLKIDMSNGGLLIKPPYLRRSFQSGQPISEILSSAFTGTVILALASIIIASLLGIVMGIFAAIKQGHWIDRLILFLTTVGISVPSFFSAILVGWLFGYILSQYTGLTVTGSLYDIDPFAGKVRVWKNLILPAIALGIRPLAIITQLTRSSMIDSLSADYIRTARSKGLSSFRIHFIHGLRNAMNPVISSISGWFASLLAGAFFVEYIFGWHGIGKVTIDALERSDLPVIMGSVILIATVFIIMNIVVDFLYAILDPRIKLS